VVAGAVVTGVVLGTQESDRPAAELEVELQSQATATILRW
jgi:hypothetical protein